MVMVMAMAIHTQMKGSKAKQLQKKHKLHLLNFRKQKYQATYFHSTDQPIPELLGELHTGFPELGLELGLEANEKGRGLQLFTQGDEQEEQEEEQEEQAYWISEGLGEELDLDELELEEDDDEDEKKDTQEDDKNCNSDGLGELEELDEEDDEEEDDEDEKQDRQEDDANCSSDGLGEELDLDELELDELELELDDELEELEEM